MAECLNTCHQHSLLGLGYMSAVAEAERRLSSGWENHRCADCGRFGWTPPAEPEPSTPQTEGADRCSYRPIAGLDIDIDGFVWPGSEYAAHLASPEHAAETGGVK